MYSKLYFVFPDWEGKLNQEIRESPYGKSIDILDKKLYVKIIIKREPEFRYPLICWSE